MTISKVCEKHGEQEHVQEKNGYFRCKKCRYGHIKSRREKLKTSLVNAAGGKCLKCDYEDCPSAMEFHHIEKETKSFTISNQWCKSKMSLEKEADKCILLCCRCHRELEAGLVLIVC